MCLTTSNKVMDNARQQERNQAKGKEDEAMVKEEASSIQVSPLFFVMALLVGVSLSYHAGRFYRQEYVNKPIATHMDGNLTLLEPQDFLDTAQYRRTTVKIVQDSCGNECREVREVTLEEIMFREGFGQYEEEDELEGEHLAVGPQTTSEEDDDDEESPGSALAHVIMDIERVDIERTDQVRHAMIETIWEASEHHDLSLLSLHCHDSDGIVCSALLEDGHHMTVVTNPTERTCSVDILFGEDDNVLSIVPILERNFGLGDNPLVRFRVALRGTRATEGRRAPLDDDLGENLMEYKNQFYFKKEIGSVNSDFQHIAVWEAIHIGVQSVDGYEKSLETGKDNYNTRNPELFHPNRMLFMDGVMQSSSRGDAAYHESLVHPAMFASAEGPKRVAIIGGGEGATLREILKHKSVEVCTMIEIDPGIVEASREWLPSMNDCSDFGTGNCFDEDRTELLCEDAFGWFKDRFDRNATVPLNMKTDPYDVLVMDALDPEDTIEFAVQLYQDTHFWGSVFDALTLEGILVVQLGQSPEYSQYSEESGKYKNRANLFKTIESVGFKTMSIYHDSHSDFKFPWSFLVACKSEACAKEWNLNEAQMDLRIRERILPTKSGSPALRYFDGATMQLYQRPPKRWETAVCKGFPTPEECNLQHKQTGVHHWSDAFDLVSSGDAQLRVTLKLHLQEGAIIRVGGLSPPPPLGEGISDPMAGLTNQLEALAECSFLKNLVVFDELDGKISPLRDREPGLFDLRVLTRDVTEGEEILCHKN